MMFSKTRFLDHASINEIDIAGLRRIPDSLPAVVWGALLIGALERFIYYAASTPWQNYMQYGPDDGDVPGALGLGEVTATGISNAFTCTSYLTPLPFAVLSDMRWGRYKTLCIGFILEFVGCIVLLVTSLPMIVSGTLKITGLACAMLLIACGTGAIKASISPFIGDQYTGVNNRIILTNRGEYVVIDRKLTMEYIFNVSIWSANIGTLSLIASTYLERLVGFWAAYLVSFLPFLMVVPLLLYWQNSFVRIPPQGSALPKALRVIRCSARDHFSLTSAMPAYQRLVYGVDVGWNESFVYELGIGLKACGVMLCFAPVFLCLNQINNNLVSQAGQTELGGIPNDTMQAFSPLFCVVLWPVIQKGLYRFLRQRKIPFGSIARMSAAIFAAGIAMALAAVIQYEIYTHGPCYNEPLKCPASDEGRIPNNVSVWIQLPIYCMTALAEILGYATLSEYSYSKAPADIRTFTQAIRQFAAAIGSVLGIMLSPLATTPTILHMFVGLAAFMAVYALAFWFAFRGDDEEGERKSDSDSAMYI